MDSFYQISVNQTSYTMKEQNNDTLLYLDWFVGGLQESVLNNFTEIFMETLRRYLAKLACFHNSNWNNDNAWRS